MKTGTATILVLLLATAGCGGGGGGEEPSVPTAPVGLQMGTQAESGTIMCWGFNGQGQTDVPSIIGS